MMSGPADGRNFGDGDATNLKRSVLWRRHPITSLLAAILLVPFIASAFGGGPLILVAQASPAPLPVISRSVPAYASVGAATAGLANDSDYSTAWRSGTAPSTANPQWLAYDVSQVASANRANVVYAWTNDSTGDYYNAAVFYALPRDYTVEAHSGAGKAQGVTTAPTTGWTTLATVTGNVYTGRSHALNLAGYNWVRIRITASRGSSGNNDVSIQADVHDASQGNVDSWLMLGDSITMEGFLPHNIDGNAWSGGSYSQLVNAANPAYFPLVLDGGNGGMNMAWANTNKASLLAPFSGRYVGISYGTNDANQSGALTSPQVSAYYGDLLGVVDYVTAQGKVPVVPRMPWGCANSGWLGTNAKTLNDYVDQHLFTDRPQVVRGPDLWTFFKNNPSLLHDCIHPTYSAASGQLNGYEQYKRLWRDAMLANVYNTSGGSTTPTPTPTNTPAPTCLPRPAVGVRTVPGTTGTLNVTLTAGSGPGAPGNRLVAVRIGSLTRVRVRYGNQILAANTRLVLPAGTSQMQFTLERTSSGSALARLTVEDICGDWPTFVGGGPTAF